MATEDMRSFDDEDLYLIQESFLNSEEGHFHREETKNNMPSEKISTEILDRIDISSIFLPNSENFDLDWERIETYISSLPEEDQSRVRFVFDQTRHISTATLFSNFSTLLQQFTDQIGSEEIYIAFCNRFSSENMYLIWFWSQLRNLKIRGFINEGSQIPEEKITVLILDDAIYTGQNMCGFMDRLLDNNPGLKVDFNLIVPYISSYGLTAIQDFLQPNAFVDYSTRASIKVFRTEEISEFDFDVKWGIKYQVFDGKRLLLYFDHKIADTTFETVYSGYHPQTKTRMGCLLRNPPNKELKSQIYTAYLAAVN